LLASWLSSPLLTEAGKPRASRPIIEDCCIISFRHEASVRRRFIGVKPSEGLWQKNRGLTGNISHFFSSFSGFSGFFPLQVLLYEQQAAIQPLQKKSCLKTDGRFSVRSGICHNRRVKVENNNWKTGRQAEKWGPKNGLLPSFCPHLFAFKVEEASCLLAVKDQRRDAPAAFPGLRSVNFELLPGSFRGCDPFSKNSKTVAPAIGDAFPRAAKRQKTTLNPTKSD
jgi:hypothetical protein